MSIHPTAIVDPQAQVDPTCQIGPYAVIGPGVRLGAGNVVGAHVVIDGDTGLGEGNRIFPFAALGQVPQDLKFRGERTRLEIGSGNQFREFCTVHLGTAGGGGVTRIGSGCLFMANSHVAHDCAIGDGAIIANSVALAGHVELEDHVHFGGLSAAHQYCRVGRVAFVSGMTGVAMDIPPYCCASGSRAELAGLNTVGMQRAGFSEEQIGRVKQAYKVVFRSNLQLAEALARLQVELGSHPEIAHFIAFIEASKRGITR
jgi:UDP-N-acetylglucosamine acyltransferase